MRNFNLENVCNSLYTKEIVDYLTMIHEYKGKQQLYIDTEPEILEKLVEIAKIKSTISSNRIEGIYTDDKRIMDLMEKKSPVYGKSVPKEKKILKVVKKNLIINHLQQKLKLKNIRMERKKQK